MSKAFTKENDDAREEPVLRTPSPLLPPGVKNYITADGARRLQEELDNLLQAERPRLTNALSDASLESGAIADARHELQLLDQRVAILGQSLQTAEVVPSPADSDDVVRFGAAVTVRNSKGEEIQYRIVGIDETDLDKNWVSWRSPIARALLNARLGQRVRFQFPAGVDQLEIIDIRYE